MGRLSPEQVDALHAHEKKERMLSEFDHVTGEYRKNEIRLRKCLMPFEIQQCFGLGSFKDQYSIPYDDLNAQASHNQRLRVTIKTLGFAPAVDVHVQDVEKVHAFDEKVRACIESGELDLLYSGGPKKKSRYSDDV